MGGNVGTKRSSSADINVVPMIDIVLVLLIIFMVITPLVVKQMDLNIPEKSEVADTPDEVPKEQVVILMSADDRIFLNKEEVTMETLEPRLEAIYRGRAYEDKVTFFDAEDATNYQAAVRVMDVARGAGVAKIGLITGDRLPMPVPGAPGAPGDPAAPPEPPAPPQ